MILMISMSLILAVIGLVVLPGLGARSPMASWDIRDTESLTQYIQENYCPDCGQRLTKRSHRRCESGRAGPGNSK